jgi:DeoR family fructose operon transcriptional repressor
MYAEERQEAMVDLVTRRGRVSVADLADAYDVTTETVRRDLTLLERAGLLRRVHGGAVLADSLPVTESALAERDLAHTAEKDRIAHAAVALLPPGDATLLLDAGSTIHRLAGALPRDRRFTVLTHAVPVAGRLASQGNVELHLLPGRVRPTTQAAVGDQTVEALARLRVDLAFVGTNGVTAGHGLSTPDAAEAAVKRAIVAAARRVVVLTDSSKIGQEHTVSFARLTDVDVLVTDAGIAEDDHKALDAAGVEVVVA